jgi:hypothetical protein
MRVMMVEVSLFELPTLLGIPQYVEYEPPKPEWCAPDSCPHEGVLIAEGCRKGVCIRYRTRVYSWDGKKWVAKERWRRRRDEEDSGCLRQQVADALWEAAERFEVEVDRECDISVSGVYIGRVSCHSVAECVGEILREYERRFREPPKLRRSPEEEEYEELLQRYPPLRFWNKASVIDALRRSDTRWGLQNLLSRLRGVDERVWAFLGRFDLDFRFAIEVYASGEERCVRFYMRDHRQRIYCYATGQGWRPVSDTPKFVRYRPLEGGGLAETYVIGGRVYVRVA